MVDFIMRLLFVAVGALVGILTFFILIIVIRAVLA